MMNQTSRVENPSGKLAEGKNGSGKKVGISENGNRSRRCRNILKWKHMKTAEKRIAFAAEFWYFYTGRPVMRITGFSVLSW
jgi:hypothetical protein